MRLFGLLGDILSVWAWFAPSNIPRSQCEVQYIQIVASKYGKHLEEALVHAYPKAPMTKHTQTAFITFECNGNCYGRIPKHVDSTLRVTGFVVSSFGR